MSTTTVTTQAELDAALADATGDDAVHIKSPAGVWLTLSYDGDARVVAWGSSRVVARDSSSVEAWGSSRVEAWGSSRVVAWGSSRVVAWGSSTTHAHGSGPIKAAPTCAVFLHHASVNVEGGVLIDVVSPDDTTDKWLSWNGVEVIDDRVIVYKAVDDRFTTDRGFDYTPGRHVTAPDWRDDDRCGGGLHFGPTPSHAKDYFWEATRYVKVSIPIEHAHPIPGGTAKIKARECLVLGEVDVHGDPIEVSA